MKTVRHYAGGGGGVEMNAFDYGLPRKARGVYIYYRSAMAEKEEQKMGTRESKASDAGRKHVFVVVCVCVFACMCVFMCFLCCLELGVLEEQGATV